MRVLPDENGVTSAAFLTRAAAYFAHHGIPRIERVLSDNAWSYRHSNGFAAAVAAIGARQKFIKPHCPWQNGKVERSTGPCDHRVGLPAGLHHQY